MLLNIGNVEREILNAKRSSEATSNATTQGVVSHHYSTEGSAIISKNNQPCRLLGSSTFWYRRRACMFARWKRLLKNATRDLLACKAAAVMGKGASFAHRLFVCNATPFSRLERGFREDFFGNCLCQFILQLARSGVMSKNTDPKASFYVLQQCHLGKF